MSEEKRSNIIRVDFGATLTVGDEIEIPNWEGLWKILEVRPNHEYVVKAVQ